MQTILCALGLWSFILTAPDECYCKHSNKIYRKVNNVAVDSIDVRHKLLELKCLKNSEDRSKEILRIYTIIETKPCNDGK